MSNALATQVTFSDLERMAAAISASKLFGIKDPQQALGLMLLCQAEGLHPAVAARDYHIVDGKPALKADAMLARFQAAGGRVEWQEYTDDRVTGVFAHPQGGSLTLTWTIEQARAAGLAGKNVWKQYPRAMLRARVISEGIRTIYPGVLVGVYTPEEVADFDARPPGQLVAVVDAPTPAAIPEFAPAIPTLSRDETIISNAQIKALAATLREAGFDSTEEGKRQGRAFLAWLCGRESLESAKDLSWGDATRILDRLGGATVDGAYRADTQRLEAAVQEWYMSQALPVEEAVA